jgi:hypothetical protein
MEEIFKLSIQNESLHEISNDNAVTALNFATSKNFMDKIQCFLITAFMNMLGSLQMGKSTVKLTMKNAVFWDVIPYGSCKNRCFKGTRLHHQCNKNW